MTKTAFSAQVESLERRDTPSSLTAFAKPHPTVLISGYGSGQVTGLSTHGKSATVSGPLYGLDVPFGAFNGTAVATLSTNKNATGSATLFAAEGDTIKLALSGPIRIPATLPQVVTGQVVFTIKSVTGPHHGATGSGTITVTINTVTGMGTFWYSGKVRL